MPSKDFNTRVYRLIPEERIITLKRLVWITYLLYAATIISGFSLIIGVVIAHLKNDEAAELEPLLATHFSWLIRTFWWSLAWSVLAALFFALIITAPLGAIISTIAGIWFVYRIVRGGLRLHANKSMPMI